MLRWLDEERTVELSVRDLVGHASDIPTLVLSPRARAKAGIDAHQLSPQDSRTAEARWRYVEDVRGWRCVLHARVDGVVDEFDGHTLIEEVKSVAVAQPELEQHPLPTAWTRQAALYLYVAMGMRLPGPHAQLRLVSLVDGSQRVVPLPPSPETGAWLRVWLAARIRARELWLARLPERRRTQLPFPHDPPRQGQTDILTACVNTIHRSEVLAVQAPTGLGKTAPVLVGTLRAALALDRAVFWATARGTQRWIIERSLAEPAFTSANLRSVTIAARAEMCPSCAVGSCDATAELADLDPLDSLRHPDAAAIRIEATRQSCCPWALAVAFATHLADVVIGDLNYVFEPDIFLRPLFGSGAARSFAVVVDEAHQLPVRAQGWASGTLDAGLCDEVDRAYSSVPPFREIASGVRALLLKGPAVGEPATLLASTTLEFLRSTATEMDNLALAHAALRRDPEDDPWRRLHQIVHRLGSYTEYEGEEIVSLAANGCLHLVCRDPSFILRPRIAATAGLVASSATLEPTWYWRDLCGIPVDQFNTLVLPSPFPAENRIVLVARTVSTTLKDRAKEHPRIAALLEESAAAIPGNIAFFFGSFDVMRDLGSKLSLPGRKRLVQSPGMGHAERASMAAAMGTAGNVLFAVLGGVFGESVDLPPGALHAAFIIGPSLAPPDFATALVQDYLERKFDDGFGLATIHPGIVRVVQAAGRVVRRPTDRGAIILVCRRFQQYEYQRYFPADWNPIATSDAPGELRAFFNDLT